MIVKFLLPYSVLLGSMVFCLAAPAQAQMFSVQSEAQRIGAPASGVFLGYEPTRFTYRDDDLPAQALEFQDPAYRLRVELPGFRGYVAFGRNLGDADSLNMFNAGASIESEYRLLPGRRFQLSIPLVLATDFLQVEQQRNFAQATDFRQSSAMVGIGLSVGARLGGQVRLTSRVIPQYGFSVTSFGGTGGSRSAIIVQNRVYVDRIYDRFGLSAGFDYGGSRFNLDDEQFNYNLITNSFLLGVSF